MKRYSTTQFCWVPEENNFVGFHSDFPDMVPTDNFYLVSHITGDMLLFRFAVPDHADDGSITAWNYDVVGHTFEVKLINN